MINKNIFLSKLLFASAIIGIVRCDYYEVEQYAFLMPNVRPVVPESYICTPIKIEIDSTYYVVEFTPNSTMHTAHHILLYGCSKPGSSHSTWNCGEMSNSFEDSQEHFGPCAENPQIIYAWARDAPTLKLPDGVGFKIGKGSSIKYLVLQVHYADVSQFEDGHTDDSGVILHVTKEPLKKQAGVIVLGTGGGIPPQSLQNMEAACRIQENKTIYPFAYRTHTHSLGKVVAGYVVKPNYKWIELGKRDPLTPQMFYKVHDTRAITYNDTLAARCTMLSSRDRWTYIGNTNKDEMCNFYLMYFVEEGEPLQQKFCFTQGPPYYYWKIDNLINIPEEEASTLN